MFMRTGRRSYARLRTGGRAKYTWATFSSIQTAFAAGAGAISLPLTNIEAALSTNLDDVVIQRIIGEISWTPDANANAQVDVGLLVGPRAITFAAVDPSVKTELGWMYLHKSMYTAASSTIVNNLRWTVDLRGRRAIRNEGDTLLYVVTNSGAQALHINTWMRVLLRTGRR